MHIAYIELNNVKSYENSGRVNFANGINAVSGKNGAGKSTILEAIGFALFDVRTHTSKNFIREGCKNGQIVIGFVDSVDERLYEVVRGINPSPGMPYIYDPEIKKKIVAGKDDVYSWIKEHLRVSSAGDLEALFQDTIGVQQGLITVPFQETPKERKIKFDKLLQVDEYDNAHKWLAEPESDLKSLISEAKANIAGIRGMLSGLPAMQEEVKNLEEQIKTTRKKLKKILNDLDDAGKEKDTLDRKKDQIDKLASEVEAQLQRIDDLKGQLEDAKRDLSAAQTANDLATKSQAGYEEFKAREAKLVELEKQRKERDAQQKQVEKINRSILEYETNTKSAENALLIIQQSEAEIDRLAPIMEEYGKIKNELATAETKVIQSLETETRLADEDKRLEDLTDDLNTVHKKLLSRVEIESVKKDIDEKRININQELATLQAQITQGEEQLSQLKERQALLSKSDTAECPICLSPLKADRIKELEQHYSGEINPLKQKIALLKKSQKEENGKLSELESQSRDCERQLERLPSVYRESELIEKIKQQKKVITSWKVKVKAFEGLDEQINKLRSQKTEFGDIESQYAIHQNAVKDLSKKEKQLEDLHTTLGQYQSQMQVAERALQPYAKLDDLTQRVQQEKENYQADHDQYLSNKQIAQQLEKRAKRANEFQDQLTKTTEANQSKQKTLTTLQESYNQTEHKRVNSDYDRLNKEHGSLENRAGMLDQQHQAAINKIQSLLPLEKELSTNEDDLRQLNSSLAVLVFLRKTIREAGPHIVKQLLQAISEEADRIFGEILTDYSARLQWADDYGINIEHQGYVREFSQLSGGEKMAAALAVRLALLHEMSEIRIAFFDEPTANLDDERRNNLAEQMTKITGFDQLFIISHDDTFEHQTDHILRVYKEEGASHIAMGG